MDETGAKITALDALTDGASDDLLAIVDVSDNDVGAGAMSADGTNKKMTLANLVSSLGALGIIIPTNGWTPFLETCTFASATTFTIAGDWRGVLQVGDKFKLTQTTDKYFYIIGVSYSSPNTTVTVTAGDDYSLANATITSPYFSKVENPQGFPTSFEFTPTITASSGTITTASGSMEFSIKNGLVAISGIIGVTNIGTGSGQLRATLPVLPATYGCGIGRENSVVGTSIHLYIAPSIAYLTAFTYSGGSCVVNNYSIRFSASYYI